MKYVAYNLMYGCSSSTVRHFPIAGAANGFVKGTVSASVIISLAMQRQGYKTRERGRGRFLRPALVLDEETVLCVSPLCLNEFVAWLVQSRIWKYRSKPARIDKYRLLQLTPYIDTYISDQRQTVRLWGRDMGTVLRPCPLVGRMNIHDASHDTHNG